MLEKIKTICGISGTSCDTDINKFINIYNNSIRKTIKEEFIFSTITSSIIETGICEIIAGNYINSLTRKKDQGKISLSSFSYEPKETTGDNLIKSGYDKLAPFTKNYNENFIYYTDTKEIF